jgi:D-cysteine desulfhydrase family pyridoxal phosphate-dependent enzyme
MIPRVRFAHLPTPIEAMPRLSAALGGPRLWVKRDDLTRPGLGGNKVRKLEYLLAEAQANGAKTLLTIGAAQSNHCRQTAALAARFGLDCILVLSGQADQAPSGNYLLDRLFGARIIWATREDRQAVFDQTFQQAWEEGLRPYAIPVGGSNATGTVGYVTAFEEFLTQGVEVDWIVVASSSAGTQAGLVLGARLAGWEGKILGISIDHNQPELQQNVARLAGETADKIGRPLKVTSDEVHVNTDYLGQGYGVLNQAEVEAIRLFARTEGLLLDPVYTGRAGAALIDLIRKGFFKPGERVLFWHTGGTPALFADVYREDLSSLS